MQTRFILVFLLLTAVLYSQSNTTSMTKKTVAANFSSPSIIAYQESAVYKIKDYYHYLEVYSSSKASDSLKTQVRIALNHLFESKNLDVVDVTTKEKKPVKIDQLLAKIAYKNYRFNLTAIESSIAVQDFWTTNYSLEVRKDEVQHTVEVFTKVIFKPVQKQFGSKTKEVWSLYLGEME